MRNYIATLEATFEIEAENAAQAGKASKHIKSVGEHHGLTRKQHERDFVRYRIKRLSESVTVRAKR